MPPSIEYAPRERRNFIEANLNAKFGWVDFQKGLDGLSYRVIARKVAFQFGLERDPSPATIKLDIEKIRDRNAHPEPDTELVALLKPETFPEWRAAVFKDPTTGKPFVTPKFQHAIFWLMYAITKKVKIPEWVIEYINSVVPDDAYKIPLSLNDKIESGEYLLSMVLLLAPRHGKTELVIHTMLFLFCEDQTTRILYGNGISETSKLMVGNVKAIMETNEPLIEAFGPFEAPKKKWSANTGLQLAGHDPQAKALSLKPFGISTSVRSLDADSIFADDLQDLDRAESEAMTRRDYKWVTSELMTRREPHTGFVYVGSHLPVDTGDLLTWIEDKLEEIQMGNHVIIMVKIPAHDYERCDPETDALHEQCVIWPELRNFMFLEAMRGLLGDVMFEAVFNQIPRSKGMMHFPPEILRTDFQVIKPDEDDKVRPHPHTGEMGALDKTRHWKEADFKCCKGEPIYVAMGFDPAAGQSKDASFSAAGVLGACVHCGRRYVIDYWYERVSPETHPATIKGFLRAYPQIKRLRIEINAYQAALARDPRLANVFNEYGVWIDEWDTDERKWDPRLGIPQMGRFFKNGLWSIPATSQADRAYGEELVKSFVRWPKPPNDVVMALWFAELSLEEMIAEAMMAESTHMPGTEGWRTDAHDEQTFEFDVNDGFFERL